MTVQHKQLNSSTDLCGLPCAWHSMLSKSPNGRYSDIGICKTGKKFPHPSRFLTISRFAYKVLLDWSISKSRRPHFFTSMARTMQSAANRQRIWKTWLTRFGAFLGWSLTMEIVCEGRVFILWRVYLFTLQVKKSAKYIQRRGQKKFLVRSMRRQTSAKGSRQKKVSACSQPCLSTRMPFSR